MKFNKILILFVIISVLASLFAVTCFADSSNGIFTVGDVYTFNNSIVYEGSSSGQFLFDFHCLNRNGDLETFYAIYFEENGNYGFDIVYYTGSDEIYVYQDGCWTAEYYRTIYVDSFVDLSHQGPFAIPNFYLNGYDGTVKYPVYDRLRDLIVKYVFNGEPLYNEQELAVSFVCLVLSLVVVATPLLVILWLSRWLATLGRGVL